MARWTFEIRTGHPRFARTVGAELEGLIRSSYRTPKVVRCTFQDGKAVRVELCDPADDSRGGPKAGAVKKRWIVDDAGELVKERAR